VNKRIFCSIFSAIVLLLLLGCGGGGSSDGSTGTLTANITDAKPVIPGDPEELWITFEEVLAHRSGGGWISLPLPQTPLTVNLLAFHDGETTQLVTPVELASGKYTQIRLVISDAYMVITGVAQSIDLDVPSGNLKTDKNFTFEVVADTAVDITVDFDLSQSIVVTGDNEYKLKPALHINETQEAATICGSIDPLAPGDPAQDVTATVIRDFNSETYTEVTVTRDSDTDSAQFCIYWLVPDEDYTVQIDEDGFDPPEFEEQVSDADLGPGDTFDLNGGLDIPI
jgi:hypothetical protein